MKVRILVGILCALFAIGCLVVVGYGYINALFFIFSLVSALCIHEIMGVSKCQNKLLTGLSMAFAALLPAYIMFDVEKYLPFDSGVLYAIYVIVVLIIMLKMFEKTKFENVAMGLFSSLAIPMSLCCIKFTVQLCNTTPGIFSRSNGVFFTLMAMYAAWLTDTFALFFGRAYGKHKLAPKISPKKSVEGAVAGILGTTLVSMITYFIFEKWYFHYHFVKWWMVIIAVPFICIMGMCGDLVASVIKRNFGVKDFGTLLPEHGGAMDRVDSFLLTMPSTYLLIKIIMSLV